jgi:hypothetical protein
MAASALELNSGMNWKLFISCVLMLLLIPASGFGLACDVQCALESMTVDHCSMLTGHSGDSNSSAPMSMSSMHCHSMRHAREADASQTVASYERPNQACNQEHCASDASWLPGQKSLSKQSVIFSISPLETGLSVSVVAVIPSPSSQRSLPPLIDRPLTALRI